MNRLTSCYQKEQIERIEHFYDSDVPATSGISTHNLLCSALNSIHSEYYEEITNHVKWLTSLILLVENIPICVSISAYGKKDDIYNPLIYVNKHFENTTQYSRNEIVGQNCNFLQGTLHEAEIHTKNNIRDVIYSGKNGKFLITNIKKDGTTFRNLLHLIPIKYETGEICYYMGIQLDLTDPKIPYDYILLVDDLLAVIPTTIEMDCDDNKDIPLYFSNMIELIGSFKNIYTC
jgi:PAS domain S-box-containing protein